MVKQDLKDVCTGLVRGLWDGPATYAAASSELTALAATFYRSAGLRLLADPPTGAHPLRSKYVASSYTSDIQYYGF